MARYFTYLYFSKIQFNGKENIPPRGKPFIFAPNHQNAFLDAVAVGALEDPPVYYLARADAFKPPWDYFLDAFHMMPIYRARDGFGSLAKNEAIFEKCSKILIDGNPLLMFPEGNQAEVRYLRPLTKGIARIALQTQSQTDEDIMIIPVGLNYFNHFESGRKLIMNFGPGFSAKEYLEAYLKDKNKAHRQFVIRLAKEMKKELVIPEKTDDYATQATMFTKANEKLSFSELRTLAAENKTFPKDKASGFMKLITGILTLPNILPFAFINHVKKNWLKMRVFHSSVKMGIGVVVFPVWWLVVFILVALIFNLKWALIVLAVQILSALIRSRLTWFVH